MELNTSNNKIGAHSYDLLQLQIWSLLPAFCSSSNDIKENFKTIAKILGDLIAGRKHLRIQAMAALRKAITKNQCKIFFDLKLSRQSQKTTEVFKAGETSEKLGELFQRKRCYRPKVFANNSLRPFSCNNLLNSFLYSFYIV